MADISQIDLGEGAGMAKLSREERAELERKLRDDDQDDPEDDEVELKFADGSAFRGSYRRAKTVAEAREFKLHAVPEQAPADDAAAADDGDGRTRRFGRTVG